MRPCRPFGTALRQENSSSARANSMKIRVILLPRIAAVDGATRERRQSANAPRRTPDTLRSIPAGGLSWLL